MATKKVEVTNATRKGSKKAAAEPVAKKNAAKKGNEFRNPYASGSVIFEAFEMAKKGTTVLAIQKMCKKRDAHSERVIRQLKWGEFRGAKWHAEFDGEKGTLKISSPRPKAMHA